MIVPLYCADPVRLVEAESIAGQFALPLCAQPPESGYWLELGPQRLQLLTHGKHGAVYAEFVSGAAKHRRDYGGGRGQPVARAIGLKGNSQTPKVVDATAGLGRDSLVLATLGCEVTMVERSPVPAALLADALQRAAADVDTAAIAARLRLIHANAADWLSGLPLSARPDVVYLDPMFPERGKNAAAKKDMQAFQQIIGEDEDSPALLAAAINAAQNRVVVKRPRQGAAIDGVKPSASIIGQSTRFDLYSIKALRGDLSS